MLSAALVIVMAIALLYFAQLLIGGAAYLSNEGPFWSVLLILGAVGVILWVANFAYMEYRTLNPIPVAVEVTAEG